MSRKFSSAAVWIVIAALGGCGGGHDPSPTAAPPARGQLITSPPAKIATLDPSTLLSVLSGSDLGKRLLQLATTPRCSIDVHHMEYRTVDPAGALTPASGALIVPHGTDPVCSGTRPILLYAHGTSADRKFDISNIASGANAEGVLLAVVFAAQGYIVVAPNYVGYDSSTLGYHPYLVADQQSKDMIDAVTAARSALPTAGAPSTMDGGKLFVTGYSQGGYVAMATARAMQSAGITVTASAPMSGPYTLSAFGDAIFEGQVSKSASANLTLVANAYQHAYKNVYSSPSDVFEAKYAPTIENLLPSTTSVPDLVTQGKITAATFNPTPPDPAFAAYTPATAPANLAPVFAQGFADDHLITNAYRLSYLEDATAAPDGGFPQASDGLPPANPRNGLRQDLKTNDLRDWTPTAPMLLCGGNSDPTVFYFNTQLMQQYWAAHPPTPAPQVLDVDSAVVASDPYESIKKAFAAAKDAVRVQAVLDGAKDGGDQAVLDAYHAGLVPPFCLSAVKSFFDSR
jgi:alpha/beta superfamily hydrolase